MSSCGKSKLTVAELTVFAMFGAIMYITKLLMQALPNIHLLGMMIMLATLLYRQKGLIPIYVYVLLEGLFGGFSLWWIPYLYIWTILWGITMLLPRNMPDKWAAIVYPLVCGAHGFLFGTLYAPAQALLFHLSFSQMLAWIAAGIPFDLLHGVSNLAAGLLVLPLYKVLKKYSAPIMGSLR